MPMNYWPWRELERVAGRGGGEPVLHGTGLLAAVIYGRWIAGEPLSEITEDYDVPMHRIEQALREWSAKPRDWRQRVGVVNNAER